MVAMVERKCACCGDKFDARVADVKRGWARFCSKSCKAIRQEQRTGQFAAYKEATSHQTSEPYFTNAHQFDNTELD